MRRIVSESLLNLYIKKYHLDGIFDDIKTVTEIHEFEVGDYVLREGDRLDYYYFLVEGKTKVCPSSIEGQVVLLDFMNPIDIIGDIEFISNQANYHDVLALKPTRLIAIPISVVSNSLSENVHFYKFLSEIMAKKILTTSKKYSNVMLYPLKVRLANYILEHYDKDVNNKVMLKFKEVADYFGITPRHLRRVMQDFEVQGLLERKVGHIVIYDLEGIRDIAKQ